MGQPAPPTDFFSIPAQAHNRKVYCIGIKGTGVCALAQLLQALGYEVSGSDTEEVFYTDQLLRESGIRYSEGFDAAQLPADTDFVIHSPAYGGENPEMARALELGLPIFSYPELLGILSLHFREAIAVAGAHGKTTSTLLLASLFKSLELPGGVIAGGQSAILNDRAFWFAGKEILAAETCEYRNHFHHFHPSLILLTSLEWDHQDFFPTYEKIEESFLHFVGKLAQRPEKQRILVYCADDEGASRLAEKAGALVPRIRLVDYGRAAQSEFAIETIDLKPAETTVRLRAFPDLPFRFHLPGEHLALNGIGALAVLSQTDWARRLYPQTADFLHALYPKLRDGLQAMYGASRRSELLARIPAGQLRRAQGRNPDPAGPDQPDLLILDDYAHHPTAIRKTLRGLRTFYPGRRLIVDFMSHTYTRTQSLHSEFAQSLTEADLLLLHKIYSSAREQKLAAENGSQITGRDLYLETNVQRQAAGKPAALYFPETPEALEPLLQMLEPGDLFLTMGAGNNRQLAEALLERLSR